MRLILVTDLFLQEYVQSEEDSEDGSLSVSNLCRFVTSVKPKQRAAKK